MPVLKGTRPITDHELSPDGARVAYGGAGGSWWILDASKSKAPPPQPEPNMVSSQRFYPASWSAAGGRILGTVLREDGTEPKLTTYSLATKRYTDVPGGLTRYAGSALVFGVWLADGRRVVLRRPDGIAVVNADTGAGHSLVQIGGSMLGKSVSVSRDNRWITWIETATEGDIWMGTLR